MFSYNEKWQRFDDVNDQARMGQDGSMGEGEGLKGVACDMTVSLDITYSTRHKDLRFSSYIRRE